MATGQKSATGGIVKPDELRKAQEQRDMAAAREAAEKMRRAEEEQQQLHEAFMKRKIGPEAIERFNTAVRKAAELGQHEIMIGQFPASWCSGLTASRASPRKFTTTTRRTSRRSATRCGSRC